MPKDNNGLQHPSAFPPSLQHRRVTHLTGYTLQQLTTMRTKDHAPSKKSLELLNTKQWEEWLALDHSLHTTVLYMVWHFEMAEFDVEDPEKSWSWFTTFPATQLERVVGLVRTKFDVEIRVKQIASA
eukprot:602109-Prorocentrum_minimum.AAC.1